ncbi:YnjH family protein [Kosakonia sp. BYX6]|uniref:YnjH family protein n=1 Tax=Kosakonia calanthes TaxID=3139408 RepID=A0ABZ3B5W4_9ENTR
MTRLKWIAAAFLLAMSGNALAERYPSPNVEVNVPPEVFSSGGQTQTTQPCMQCCVYNNQNYSEGAVIKTEGVLLQCQRDERTISTNPLVWRRVKP